MKTATTMVVVLLAAVAVAGCRESDTKPKPPSVPASKPAPGSAPDESRRPVKFIDARPLLRPEMPDSDEAGGFRNGVIRSEADLRAHGIKRVGAIDWSKHNVLFILARHPFNMGIYKDFRISEVLRYPDSILVRTRIIEADYTLPAGGPGSHTFHALLIPATNLRVKFETRDNVEQRVKRVRSGRSTD